MSQKNGLSRKQEIFLNSLLEGQTIVASAKVAGVSERTAHNWLDNPVFAQAYERSRKQLLDQSLANLHSKFGKAVGTLEHHLDAPKTIPRDQIESAKTVIAQTIQTAQLTERIRELESLLAAKEQESQDHLIVNARLLTKEERDTIEAIIDRVIARNAVVIDGPNTTK